MLFLGNRSGAGDYLK